MMRQTYLALDVGTTNVKAAVVTSSGDIIRQQSCPVPVSTFSEYMEADARELLETVLGLIRELRVDHSVGAMALSCQMAGLVVLDNQGKALFPIILGIDRRGEAYLGDLNRLLGMGQIYGQTGCPAQGTYWPGKWLWLKEKYPRTVVQAAFIMGIKEYLLLQLCGRWDCDYVTASATQVFSQPLGSWWPEMMGALDLHKEQLPTLGNPSDCLGRVRPSIRKRLDLSENMTVLLGAGDGLISSLASDALQPGDLCVSMGTTVVTRYLTSQFLPKVGENAFYQRIDGVSYLKGERVSLAGRRIECMRVRAQGREEPVEQAYYWRGELHGVEKLNAAQQLRALLEGILFDLFHTHGSMVADGKIRRICCSGGGSANSSWMQAMANLFQIPVVVFEDHEILRGLAAIFQQYENPSMPLLGWRPRTVGRVYRPQIDSGLTQRYHQYAAHMLDNAKGDGENGTGIG